MSHEPEAATKTEIIAIYGKIVADLKAQALKTRMESLEYRNARDEWIDIANKEASKIAELEATISKYNMREMNKSYMLERIQTLESALITREARNLLAMEDGGKFLVADVDCCPKTCDRCHEECDLSFCPSKDFWEKIARQQLQAEGLLTSIR
jgi:hypothetical protein